MKAPRCRLCGEVHWSHEPHKFVSVPLQCSGEPAAIPLQGNPPLQPTVTVAPIPSPLPLPSNRRWEKAHVEETRKATKERVRRWRVAHSLGKTQA